MERPFFPLNLPNNILQILCHFFDKYTRFHLCHYHPYKICFLNPVRIVFSIVILCIRATIILCSNGKTPLYCEMIYKEYTPRTKNTMTREKSKMIFTLLKCLWSKSCKLWSLFGKSFRTKVEWCFCFWNIASLQPWDIQFFV